MPTAVVHLSFIVLLDVHTSRWFGSPISGVVVGAVLLGEALRPLTIAGGLLVLLGVAFATLPAHLLRRVGLLRGQRTV